MSMIAIILSVLALYLVQLFVQEVSRHRLSLKSIVGNRDTLPNPTPVAARLERAKNNLLEAMPFFVPLAILLVIQGDESRLAHMGAMVFLVARIAYVPAYASGLSWLRSIIWLVANAGLVAMAIAVLR